MPTLSLQFAKNLRAIRDYVGMTREQFCGVIKIPLTTLIALERAKNSPSLKMLGRIAGGLKAEPWELIRFDPEFVQELLERITHSLNTSQK